MLATVSKVVRDKKPHLSTDIFLDGARISRITFPGSAPKWIKKDSKIVVGFVGEVNIEQNDFSLI